MKALWPIVNPRSPSIANKARRYELKLRQALAIAAKKGSRRDPRLAALYAGAVIEGLDSKLKMKKAVITFTAPPFRGGLHQIYDWDTLDAVTVQDRADTLAWSLEGNLQRARRPTSP